MEQQTQIHLIEEVIEMAEASQPYLKEGISPSPVSRYNAPDRFEAERAMMHRVPLMAALSSELPEPGSFLTKEMAGLPILITRDKAGQVHGFLNVCRHRGTRLVDEACGKKSRFSCPYHAWTWDNQGTLKSVPHQETGFPGLDMAEKALVRIAVTERYGFVWVRLNGEDLDDLDDFLGEIGPELTWMGAADSMIFTADELDIAANWKILVEGGIESYHFKIAHRKTIGPYFVDNGSTYQMLGRHMRSVLPRESVRQMPLNTKDNWDIREHNNIIYSVVPSSQFLVQQDHFIWITLTPLAHNRTRLRLATIVPKSETGEYSYEERAHWEQNHKITLDTLSEDFAIGESIQSGLDSGANTHFTLGRFESALEDFNDQIEALL